MYFNTRYYDNYTMPAGIYDALRITVGDGKGHNWWCVMYPSICISSAVDTDEKVEKLFRKISRKSLKEMIINISLRLWRYLKNSFFFE